MPATLALVLAESISKGVGALMPKPCSVLLSCEKRLELSGKNARAKMRRKRESVGKAKNTPVILAYESKVWLGLDEKCEREPKQNREQRACTPTLNSTGFFHLSPARVPNF